MATNWAEKRTRCYPYSAFFFEKPLQSGQFFKIILERWIQLDIQPIKCFVFVDVVRIGSLCLIFLNDPATTFLHRGIDACAYAGQNSHTKGRTFFGIDGRNVAVKQIG